MQEPHGPVISKVRLVASRVATLGVVSLAETTCRRAIAIVLLAPQLADTAGEEALRLVRAFKTTFAAERNALSPKPPSGPLAVYPGSPLELPLALRAYAWPTEGPIPSKLLKAQLEALVGLLPCRATHCTVAQLPVQRAPAGGRGPVGALRAAVDQRPA